MPRTPEQVAADDKLREAVQESLRAHGLQVESLTTTDYLLLVSAQGWDDEGDQRTSYNWLMSDEGLPWHRALGLIDISRIMMLAMINEEPQ